MITWITYAALYLLCKDSYADKGRMDHVNYRPSAPAGSVQTGVIRQASLNVASRAFHLSISNQSYTLRVLIAR